MGGAKSRSNVVAKGAAFGEVHQGFAVRNDSVGVLECGLRRTGFCDVLIQVCNLGLALWRERDLVLRSHLIFPVSPLCASISCCRSATADVLREGSDIVAS